MGMLMRSLSVRGQPPRLTLDDGSTSSASTILDSPCHQGEGSQCAEVIGSQVQLPEDILHHIHALMLMRDAARAACVSRGFLHSWKYYPKLILDVNTLGLNTDASKGVITKKFISTVDHIMHNHAGTGLSIFKLVTYPCSNIHPSYVDRWLQIAITPATKELTLQMTEGGEIEYNFPCSLLSSDKGSSFQSIFVAECSLHSVVQVGSMRSLTRVGLRSVHITGEELCCFLSNCCSLEHLRLSQCDDIIFLNIPCVLLRFIVLDVTCCRMLEIIESNAPRLSTFNYNGRVIQISLGASLEVRKLGMACVCEPDMLYYASTRLLSIAPNIQSLYLSTRDETVDTPMVLGRFLQLNYSEIELFRPSYSPDYDFCSLVSFIDASPNLRTFILRITLPAVRHDSILEDLNGDALLLPRRLPTNNHHDKLREVMITGFCSARGMIEFTRHLVQKALSLERLTLDTTRGYDKRFVKSDRCLSMSEEALTEAGKACLAIRKYVEGALPSTVHFKVIEPCSKCHSKTPISLK